MSDSGVLDTLRSVEFFKGFDESQLEQLAELARPVEFPARCAIFHEHDKAEDIYVIVSGKVSLVICEPHVGCRQLMQVGDGELMGWSPIVGRPRLSDTARTLTHTKALALNGHEVLELCNKNADFGFSFMSRAAMVLAERLSATRLQLLEMTGSRLPAVQVESD